MVEGETVVSILEIYRRYHLLPNLQTHQLRVAGVGLLLAESFDANVETDAIVQACLLHDMANVIKFRLGDMPEVLEPEGLAYWQKVQIECKAKYGTDEHAATDQILDEIGVAARVREIVHNMGFSKSASILASTDWELKIIAYADQRVGPFGVISLAERLQDLRVRYAHKISVSDDARFAGHFENWLEIERQIFARCGIEPEEISEAKVIEKRPILETIAI